MPQTIKLKRSATPGQIPTTGQLDLGEIAINTADGKLFLRKSNGTTDVVMELNGSVNGSSTSTSTGVAAPTDPAPTEGDLWFDTTNDKLMYYSGIAWVEVASTLTDLTVTGNTTLGDAATDTLNVTATADFNSPVNIDGAFTTTGTGTFGDAAGDTQTFNGSVDMNDTLNVDGAVTLNANTTIGDAAADTLTVNSTATFANNMSVNGNTTLGNAAADTLTVNATSNFIAAVDMDSTLNVDGAATFNGNLTLGNAGADTMTVNATSTFANAVNLHGNTTIGNAGTDTLTVAAAATFNGGLTIQSGDAFTLDGIGLQEVRKFNVYNSAGAIVNGFYVLDTDTTITN